MASKRDKRLPKWIWMMGGILISVLLLIGLPILGAYKGLELANPGKNRAVGRWRSLGTPPQRPTAIVDANLDRVYVRGEAGALFECDRTGRTEDHACWKEVEQPQQSGAYVRLGAAYSGKRPPPPGPV